MFSFFLRKIINKKTYLARGVKFEFFAWNYANQGLFEIIVGESIVKSPCESYPAPGARTGPYDPPTRTPEGPHMPGTFSNTRARKNIGKVVAGLNTTTKINIRPIPTKRLPAFSEGPPASRSGPLGAYQKY